MSKARRMPGQSISRRLFRRAAVRPEVGPKPSFYARFGLADPVSFGRGWMPPEAQDGDDFTFLSAAPYYEALFGLGGERARLLARFDGPVRRSPLASQELGRRRPSILAREFSSSEALTYVEWLPAGADEEHGREEGEQDVSRRTRVQRRPAIVAAPQARPLDRVMAQPGARADSALTRELEEIGELLRGEARGQMRRSIARIRRMPASRQLTAAKRLARDLKGPLLAQSRQLPEAMEAISERPLQVAMDRAPAPGRQRKGLRRVVDSSPALLALEPPAPEAPPAEPALPIRKAQVAPGQSQIRQTSHRTAPAARVLREVRTQAVSGRAGPSVSLGPTTGTERLVRRQRPTEWVASLAAERAIRPSEMQTSRGLAAASRVRVADQVQAARPSTSSRVAARAAAGVPESHSITPMAMGYLAERAVPLAVSAGISRRGPESVFLSEAPVEPVSEEAVDSVPPTRRRARAVRETAYQAVARSRPTPEEPVTWPSDRVTAPTERVLARQIAGEARVYDDQVAASPTRYVSEAVGARAPISMALAYRPVGPDEAEGSDAPLQDVGSRPRPARVVRASTAPVVHSSTERTGIEASRTTVRSSSPLAPMRAAIRRGRVVPRRDSRGQVVLSPEAVPQTRAIPALPSRARPLATLDQSGVPVRESTLRSSAGRSGPVGEVDGRSMAVSPERSATGNALARAVRTGGADALTLSASPVRYLDVQRDLALLDPSAGEETSDFLTTATGIPARRRTPRVVQESGTLAQTSEGRAAQSPASTLPRQVPTLGTPAVYRAAARSRTPVRTDEAGRPQLTASPVSYVEVASTQVVDRLGARVPAFENTPTRGRLVAPELVVPTIASPDTESVSEQPLPRVSRPARRRERGSEAAPVASTASPVSSGREAPSATRLASASPLVRAISRAQSQLRTDDRGSTLVSPVVVAAAADPQVALESRTTVTPVGVRPRSSLAERVVDRVEALGVDRRVDQEPGALAARDGRSSRVEMRLPESSVDEEARSESSPAAVRRASTRAADQPVPSATSRAVARAAEPPSAQSRQTLFTSAVTYLEDEDLAVDAAVAPKAAPTRRDTPTVRALSRSEVVPRVDERGVTLLMSTPTDYLSLAQARAVSMDRLSDSPLERSAPEMAFRLADLADLPDSSRPVGGPEETTPRSRLPRTVRRSATTAAAARGEIPSLSPAVSPVGQPSSWVASMPRFVELRPDIQTLDEGEEVRLDGAARARRPRVSRQRPEADKVERRTTRGVADAAVPTRGSRRGERFEADIPRAVRASEGLRKATGVVRGATARAAARLNEAVTTSLGEQATLSAAPTAHALPGFTWATPPEKPEAGQDPTPGGVRSGRVRRQVAAAARAASRSPDQVITIDSSRRVLRGPVSATPTLQARVEQRSDGSYAPVVVRTQQGRTIRLDPAAMQLPGLLDGGPAVPSVAGAVGEDGVGVPERRSRSVQRWIESRAAVDRAVAPSASPVPSAVQRAFPEFSPSEQSFIDEPVGLRTRRPGVETTLIAPTTPGAVPEGDVLEPGLPSRRTARSGRRSPVRRQGTQLPSWRRPAAPETQVDSPERPRRRTVVGAMSLADRDHSPEDVEDEPGWSRRASTGTAARPRPSEERDQRAASESVGPRSPLFAAMARANTAEEIVQLIVSRGDQLSGFAGEMPRPAAKLVERIAQVGLDARSALGRLESSSAYHARATTFIQASSQRESRQASSAPVRNPVQGATAMDGMGAARVTKLAQKLMDLIHLAESEQRVGDAQAQVRMAEDSAEARAEGSAAQSSGDQESVNIKALQRDVLSFVLGELELITARQEDPDGRNIWW